MLNYINSLKLNKIKSTYRTEWTRYEFDTKPYEDDYQNEYKYRSDRDVCIVVENYEDKRQVYLGLKAIDYDDNEFVVFHCPTLTDIKAVYSQLVNENKLNVIYFL